MHGLWSFNGRRRSHALRVTTSLAAAVLLIGQARPDAAGNAALRAPTIAYSLDLPGGQTAKGFSNWGAAIFCKDRMNVEFLCYPVTPQYDEAAWRRDLPDSAELIDEHAACDQHGYAYGRAR